uniref:(northern house mosquito) hypothetical protein n=1 Tax=Culex pipiens TaxID=7175 RepID=A0A8D8EW56_CULPI
MVQINRNRSTYLKLARSWLCEYLPHWSKTEHEGGGTSTGLEVGRTTLKNPHRCPPDNRNWPSEQQRQVMSRPGKAMELVNSLLVRFNTVLPPASCRKAGNGPRCISLADPMPQTGLL